MICIGLYLLVLNSIYFAGVSKIKMLLISDIEIIQSQYYYKLADELCLIKTVINSVISLHLDYACLSVYPCCGRRGQKTGDRKEGE